MSEIVPQSCWMTHLSIAATLAEEAALNWQAHLLPILMNDTPDCIYVKDTESRFVA